MSPIFPIPFPFVPLSSTEHICRRCGEPFVYRYLNTYGPLLPIDFICMPCLAAFMAEQERAADSSRR